MNSIKKYLVIIVCCLVAACSGSKDKYSIDAYYDKETQEIILTNAIILIYKTPKGVRKEEKHNPEFRSLYKKVQHEFKWVYYYIDDQGYNYFYMVRPAKNAKGHVRGVAGKFKLADDLSLLEFEEIFNTPMLPEEEVLSKGEYLWQDLMYYDNVDRYFLNKGFIEFPDERCRYDFEKKEWRYDVPLNK